jgi:uncharacterized protein (TIRG00374 family)
MAGENVHDAQSEVSRALSAVLPRTSVEAVSQAAPLPPSDPQNLPAVAVAEDGGGPPGGAEAETPATHPPKRKGLRGLLPAPIWQVGRLLFLALIVEYLVVPQLAGPRKLAHLLVQVNPLLLLLGVALEVAALVCYAQLTRTVLPSRHTLSLFTVLRIQLTTLSVSHCAPGGSATGTALGYRLMTHAGVSSSDVGFALAMQGIGSAVVLNVLLWVALVVSIPVWGFSAVYLVAAAVGVVLLGTATTVLFLFTRGEQRVGAALERAADRVPFLDGAALRRSFEQAAGRLQQLGGQPRLLVLAALWATLNWLCDAASLEVFIGAFGRWVNPDGLLVAYGLANVLAVIPLTPGGLGVIEATLTSVLVGFGTPRGVATLGVVGYRLVNFWLPIPVGGLAYLSLQVNSGGPTAAPGNPKRGAGRRVVSAFARAPRRLLHRGSGS